MGLLDFFKKKPAPSSQGSPEAWQNGYAMALQDARGGYAGGRLDRFTFDFNPALQSPLSMGRLNEPLLRRRAYELVENNPFAAAAVNAYIANVIECGIEAYRDDEWEKEWNRWSGTTPHGEPYCDLARLQTLPEMMATFLYECIVAGSILTIRKPVARKSQRVPLALQFKGRDWFRDEIDSFSQANNPKTANRVIQGIEIEQATGRHVAFHVYRYHPSDEKFDPTESIRISAEVAKYSRLPEGRLGGFHGVTKLRTALLHIYGLGHFFDNELEASKQKSSFSMVMTRAGDWQGGGNLSSDSCLTDLNGNPITELQRGMIANLGPGGEIKGVGPNVPPGDAVGWAMFIERTIALGMDLSFESMFRNYSEANFSANRMSLSQDKKRFLKLQWWVVNQFLSPTMAAFDLAAVGEGLFGFPGREEFLAQRDEIYDGHDWVPPVWESPNPREDAAANDLALRNGTKSRAEVIRERGGRPNKVFEAIEAELAIPVLALPAPAAADPAADASPNDTPAKKKPQGVTR